jgi:hypothetical protein
MLYVRFVIKDAPYKTNKQRNNSDHWKLLIKNLIMEITNKKTLPALKYTLIRLQYKFYFELFSDKLCRHQRMRVESRHLRSGRVRQH